MLYPLSYEGRGRGMVKTWDNTYARIGEIREIGRLIPASGGR